MLQPHLRKSEWQVKFCHYGQKILVVEDVAFTQLVITSFLNHLGYQFDVTDDGLSALGHNLTAYQLILTDIRLPHLNGIELARHIRAMDDLQELPIIAVTAMDINEQVCFAAGINQVLRKPITLKQLDAVLAEWLG